MRETFMVTQDEIGELAERVMKSLLLRNTGKAKVVHLSGDLGAGKTTFTKELAGLLGIEKDEVSSPTFILKREYKAPHSKMRRLVHIDAYRFSSPEEEKVLRLRDDMQDEGALIAIEWPGKMTPMNPDLEIFFTVVDDETREVTLTYGDH